MEMARESRIVNNIDPSCGGGSAFQAVVDELEARQKDLVIAAELGNQLLRQNEQLRRQNNDIMEHFRQRIFELEEEKCSLKQRLTNVESDYDAQIKELQFDVVSLRADIQKQKNLYRELESDQAAVVGELSQQNNLLTEGLRDAKAEKMRVEKDLATVQMQMEERKNSMQGHLQQLDSLRQEIKDLRGQKCRLEKELAVVTDERDQLLNSLSDESERILLMQNVQDEQLATINHQERTIVELQNRATTLHAHLQDLSSFPSELSAGVAGSSEPHHSLMAELNEERIKRQEQFALTGLDSAVADDEVVGPGAGYDTDEVEMDDEAMLAFVSSYYGSITGLKCANFAVPGEGGGEAENNNSLLRSLGLEITEIYQQMQQMCIELSALQNARSTSSNQRSQGDHIQSATRPGTSTPDELAMVEMEVRLESLRSVLVNLGELLQELTQTGKVDRSGGNDSNEQSDMSQSGSRDIQTFNYIKTPEQTEPPSTDTEAADMLSQRAALLVDVASTHSQLTSVRQDIERMDRLMKNGKPSNQVGVHLGIWQELTGDDEQYEFEYPR